ncbi:MAG: sigma-70 family RNA polymerase sigma factor [Candidatus Paceibacterota bacterium]|jgi:RNA polymerase sigma-70 factor (ECF subfamily)
MNMEQPNVGEEGKSIEDQIADLHPYVRKYLASLRCNENDLDNLTQDVMMKAIKSADKFNKESSLKTWITTITRNTFFTFYQKGKKNREILVGFQTDPKDGEFDHDEKMVNDLRLEERVEKSPDEEVLEKEQMEMLKKILSELDPETRNIVEDRYIQEMSTKEIAEKYNLPHGTVRSKLFYVREKMKHLKSLAERS